MKKKHIKPEAMHTPFSHYSHAVMVEGAQRIIFCAGQVAGDAEGNILGPGDFDAQGELVMANIKKVLADADATLGDVVKLVSYVCSPHDVQKLRALEPIQEVVESDESFVIHCRAPETFWRGARCGRLNTGKPPHGAACVTRAI